VAGDDTATSPASRSGGLLFPDRSSLREWLGNQDAARGGVWLVLGKPGGPTTVTAAEALEEALCHGWIDGQMKRVDDETYLKYFAPRRRGSVWSARNRALAEQLVARGLMTQRGLDAIAAAKAAGTWDAPAPARPDDAQVAALDALIAGREPAYENWRRMPPSVRRTYTAAYLDARSDATRSRRLEWIIDRLDRNLRPM
jgi:uncharacterized protein YdeI (YjbR/CyaY-like superfamily)